MNAVQLWPVACTHASQYSYYSILLVASRIGITLADWESEAIKPVGRHRSVAATLIAFLFFALSFREQPFKATHTNRLKLFSEFQIFGVPLSYARSSLLI
jgi:hypothetical protein